MITLQISSSSWPSYGLTLKLKIFFYKYKEEEDVLKAIEEIGKGAKIRETRWKYNIPHMIVDGGWMVICMR